MTALYHVMTIYGTRQKTFQHKYNAIYYYRRLVTAMGDANLVEFILYKVDDMEYIHTPLED